MPSLNLGTFLPPIATLRQKSKQSNKSLVLEILESQETDKIDSVAVSTMTSPLPLEVPSTSQKKQEKNSYDILLDKYRTLLGENDEVKKQLIEIKKQNHSLKAKISTLEKDLQFIASKLNIEESYRVHIEESLKQFLTKAQRDIIINKKKRVVWSSEDISNAFAIRYFSKRCYMYLREKQKYPLPGISSLQRWASRLEMREGILTDVLRIMSIAAHEMSDFEKVTVIQFDEVKVNTLYEYDKSVDEVVGPHSQLQVVMVRGLFSKWKQPV